MNLQMLLWRFPLCIWFDSDGSLGFTLEGDEGELILDFYSDSYFQEFTFRITFRGLTLTIIDIEDNGLTLDEKEFTIFKVLT